jgi:hypothetical protein
LTLRKLSHNEGTIFRFILLAKYFSRHQVKGVRAHIVSREAEDKYIRAFIGKSEIKKRIGRPRRKLQDNTEMDLQERGWRHGLDLSGSV